MLSNAKNYLTRLLIGVVCTSGIVAQSGRSKPAPVAQTKPTVPCKDEEQSTPIRVRFNVLVTDPTGKPVEDVTRDDFRILEDENPQQLTVFDKREGPISYGLLVDASGSLRARFKQVISAARALVQENEPNDETFLTRFISSDKIELVEESTSNQTQLLKKLDDLWIEGGQSAIIDAVYEGARHLSARLASSPVRKRGSLVLITDGEDRASYYSKEQLLGLLRKLDVQILVIAFTQDVVNQVALTKATKLLLALTQNTGGRVVFVSNQKEISEAVRTIRQELAAQFIVGYESGNKRRDNLTKNIRIEIDDKAGRESRQALARTSYVALCQ